MKIYAVATREWVDIPEKNFKKVTRGGTHFIVGTYKSKKPGKTTKTYEAWKITGRVSKDKKSVKKVVKKKK